MKKMFLCLLVAAGLFSFNSNSHAQLGGRPGGAPGGMNAAMTKLFGKTTAFSAKTEMKMLDSDKKESMSMQMDMAFLDGKMRADMDMGKMKSAMMPAQAMEQMKQMGMDKMSTISRPDTKKSLIIYSGLKSYVEMPMPKEEADAAGKEPKMEKTSLGKETIDTHPCEKSKVVLTEDDGKKHEFTIWSATDLKDFPVKMETKEGTDTIVVLYKDIQFAKPDAKLFEAPAGFEKFEDMQGFQAMLMQKMMKAQGVQP